MLIVDTAGRLAIDEEMMAEVRALHGAVDPVETLFVVDSMTGQDAAKTAKAFDEALSLTGVILTKADGDARGGAALSIRYVTGKPVKFIGVGEKVDALQPFYPDRTAGQILGMGVSGADRASRARRRYGRGEKPPRRSRKAKVSTWKIFAARFSKCVPQGHRHMPEKLPELRPS